MKTIILMFALAAFAVEGYSQNNHPKKKSEKNQATKPAKYWCPVADHAYSSDLPGVCPLHNVSLVKEGDYYCEPTLSASNTEEPEYLENQDQNNGIIQQSGEPGTCVSGQPMKKMKPKTNLLKESPIDMEKK